MNLDGIRQSWLTRIIKKWLWLLGLIPLLTDYLSTYVPPRYFPPLVRSIIDQGTPWPFTVVFLTIGLLISAYLVHREDRKRIQNLQKELDRQSSLGPEIDVSLLFEGQDPGSEIEVPLLPKPTKQDFDELVEKKRTQLLSQRKPPPRLDNPFQEFGRLAEVASIAAMREPNPDYEEEVEEYLRKYRRHLEIKHDLRVDRAYSLSPYVINLGNQSATSVSVELTMPEEYDKPAPHQEIKRRDLEENLLYAYSIPPREPKRYRSKFDLMNQAAFMSPDPEAFQEAPSDIFGPDFDRSNDTWRIIYDVGGLVPKRPVKDLDPFWIWAYDVEPGDEWVIVSRAYAEELSDPQSGYLTLKFVNYHSAR